MQRRTPRPLGLALALAVAMSGCQSTRMSASAPTHTSSPNVSVASTPASTPSEAMTAGFKVSDVQEAERVYRGFYSTLAGIQRTGGAPKLPHALDEFLDEPANSYIEAMLRSEYERGVKLSSSEDGSLTLVPAEGKQRTDSVVALRACADESQLVYVRSDGATLNGHQTLNYIYLHRSQDGHLSIFDTTTTSDVSACS